jgi:voltage-gated potassium channel Kch
VGPQVCTVSWHDVEQLPLMPSVVPTHQPTTYICVPVVPLTQAGQAEGYNVVYGDGSRVAVLKAAGISRPRAIAVCMTTSTVSRLLH